MKHTLQDTGETILRRGDELAELVTGMQYSLQPDLNRRFGDRGRIKTKQDTVYNLKYLAQSIQVQSPLLFANYIQWVKNLLAGYNVTADDLIVNIHCIRDVLEAELEPEPYAEVTPFLELALHQVKEPADVHQMPDNDEMGSLARRYTELLLVGDRLEAGKLVMELVQGQMPVDEIYFHIFQQSQYEIGRLWQANKITIAQEHYASAATQMIMSQLYPYIFSTARNGYRMVAACVGEELHEIGLRMVSDLFEMEGWDTYYVGANVPSRSLIQTICDRRPHVLAVSATMTYHVTLVKKLIEEVRQDPACGGVRIMVGGLPFNIDPELWKHVGADGYAANAKEGIARAYELVRAGQPVKNS
ncbi:cobalamin-binding protein [Paenibacillus sambharensis]|uniref:Cobalamin-binding protein n=1 Tax=Paenibacillus sambharensis TaxID=1803190 RepID=A0A2W1LRV0_9BACL|nr:cobalamin-dependent protein [Paenibacillus sambharensis]PZD97702.1 cobalamin-binding protein [Paenibacillus sambharensis]